MMNGEKIAPQFFLEFAKQTPQEGYNDIPGL
jgi:hypothetical protein